MSLSADTILAVSSPPGRSPRGMIRVSGSGLRAALGDLFESPPPPRILSTCRLRDLALPCLILHHPAPRSFTTEDVLELQIPGNPALLDRVLHLLLAVLRRHDPGTRLAEPGEFTQRAFLAGRIDLTRAEGIAATIAAGSDAQLQAAKLLRTGKLGRWAEGLVDRLAQLLALVEAGIDFVDQDDVVPIKPADLDDGLAAVERELREMLTRSRSWSALESLPWVVLVGRPNAGKSTLFNALLGHERAVTSEVAGTTRDVLPEPLRVATETGEAEVMLADAAGIDDSGGSMNEWMQAAAREAIARAELVVVLHDPLDPEPFSAPRTDAPILHVSTKADLHRPARPGGFLEVSAVTGAGLSELRDRIAQTLSQRAVTLAGEMLALTPRHHDELSAALLAAQEARAMLAPHRHRHHLPDMELVAQSMRQTLDRIGALGGQMTADDVIGKVFATFCVGK